MCEDDKVLGCIRERLHVIVRREKKYRNMAWYKPFPLANTSESGDELSEAANCFARFVQVKHFEGLAERGQVKYFHLCAQIKHCGGLDERGGVIMTLLHK